MTKLADLNLYINELHLQGARGNPEQIRAVVEQELARLCAEQGTPPTQQPLYKHATLNHHKLAIKPGATGDKIAYQVAQHIYTRFLSPLTLAYFCLLNTGLLTSFRGTAI